MSGTSISALGGDTWAVGPVTSTRWYNATASAATSWAQAETECSTWGGPALSTTLSAIVGRAAAAVFNARSARRRHDWPAGSALGPAVEIFRSWAAAWQTLRGSGRTRASAIWR